MVFSLSLRASCGGRNSGCFMAASLRCLAVLARLRSARMAASVLRALVAGAGVGRGCCRLLVDLGVVVALWATRPYS